jgi:hypothetical protein
LVRDESVAAILGDADDLGRTLHGYMRHVARSGDCR